MVGDDLDRHDHPPELAARREINEPKEQPLQGAFSGRINRGNTRHMHLPPRTPLILIPRRCLRSRPNFAKHQRSYTWDNADCFRPSQCLKFSMAPREPVESGK
jgi:hypothetical protein